MQGSGHGKTEGCNDGFELVTIFGVHQVAALHGAYFGGNHRAAAIDVLSARLDQWLQTYDTSATDFFYMTVAIGDHPMPGQ